VAEPAPLAGSPVPLTPAGSGSPLYGKLSGRQLPGFADSPGPDVEELVRRWLLGKRSTHTRAAYRRDIGLWLDWCAQLRADPQRVGRPGREAGGVSRSHVEAWVRSLEAAGVPAVTVARRISAVSSWYLWLRQAEYVPFSPVADVVRPAVDRDSSSTPGMTRGQAAALLAAADADRHRCARLARRRSSRCCCAPGSGSASCSPRTPPTSATTAAIGLWR